MNREGTILLELLEATEWTILNAGMEGDGGETVIDYILGDEDTRRWVKKLEIGDNVDSDHQPVIGSVGGEEGGGNEEWKENEKKGLDRDREGEVQGGDCKAGGRGRRSGGRNPRRGREDKGSHEESGGRGRRSWEKK